MVLAKGLIPSYAVTKGWGEGKGVFYIEAAFLTGRFCSFLLFCYSFWFLFAGAIIVFFTRLIFDHRHYKSNSTITDQETLTFTTEIFE